MKSDNTSINVFMIAYNQEKYIAKAIEGVISQECNFPVKLVIGEDCSQDSTRDICEHYASQHPDKITLLPSTENLGIQANFFRTLQACCDATYVAFCEGDDAWTDTNKLSHQIDFLKSNPDAVAHTHNVERMDLRNNTSQPFGELKSRYLTDYELFNEWSYHTVSLFARCSALRDIPYAELPYFISADRFLSNWLALKGKVYYEGEQTMAIYHRHDSGASTNYALPLSRAENIRMLDFFRPRMKNKALYNATLKNYIQNYYVVLAKLGKNAKCERNRLKDFFKYLKQLSVGNMKSDIYVLLLILFGDNVHTVQASFRRKKNHADTKV